DLSELVYPRRTIPPARGDDKCDGLVIVEDSYLDQLQALKDEINFGLIMEIVPVSQVIATYPSSSDRAEKLRRFIQSANQEWGISGVFLVGSVEEVPVRLRRGYSPNTPNYMNIPSDMYFSALDGDWNTNGDAYFGDSDDDDFAPDIIVGRFQPEDSSEVTAYLDKITYHRWEIDFDFAKKWMFMGASIQGTDHMGPTECDSIITAGPIPEDVNIQKVYAFADTTGGDVELTEANVLSAISDGRYIIFHFDHGFRYILHTGKHTDRGSGIDIPQFLSMTNAPYTPFLYSYSCEVSAFDVGCVGSASIRAKNGGLIGILAHSKSAYSNHKGLVHHFWHDNFLTRGNSVKLGEAIQGTQIDLGITTTGKYYKTIMNLLGYPFLDMYLGEPTLIDVRPYTTTLTSSDTLLELEAVYM
ncbi:MAG: C25 family cysteine peptidase, partial [bacterium]